MPAEIPTTPKRIHSTMGNQLPNRCVTPCNPVCCAMCMNIGNLGEDVGTGDASRGSASVGLNGEPRGKSAQLFANAASVLTMAAEEISLDDNLEKELANEVELWRMETSEGVLTKHGMGGMSALAGGCREGQGTMPFDSRDRSLSPTIRTQVSLHDRPGLSTPDPRGARAPANSPASPVDGGIGGSGGCSGGGGGGASSPPRTADVNRSRGPPGVGAFLSGGRLGPPVVLPAEFRPGGVPSSAVSSAVSWAVTQSPPERLAPRSPTRPRASPGLRARTASPLNRETAPHRRLNLEDEGLATGSSSPSNFTGGWLEPRAEDAAVGPPKAEAPRARSAECSATLAALRVAQAMPPPFDVREEVDKLRHATSAGGCEPALQPGAPQGREPSAALERISAAAALPPAAQSFQPGGQLAGPKLWPGPGGIAAALPTVPPSGPQGGTGGRWSHNAEDASFTSSDESTFAGFIEDPLETERSGEVLAWFGIGSPALRISASNSLPEPPAMLTRGNSDDEEVKPDRSPLF